MTVYRLRVTDFITTVDLSSTATVALDYVPAIAEPSRVRLPETRHEGAPVTDETTPNAVDVVRVALLDNNATSRATVNTLNRLFRQAANRQRRKPANPVYVEFRADDTETYWRSELLSGWAQWDADALGWQWRGRALVASISWERRPYFEAAEAELPLSNRFGSGVTGGLAIANHFDGGDDNFVTINGASVTGDLAAPCRIQLTNIYNSTSRANTIYIAHNAYSDPANFTHILEAEAGSGGALQSTGTASGGAYINYNWSGSGETLLATWTLPTSVLNAARGNFFRVLAALPNSGYSAGLWLRIRVLFLLDTIWEGPLIAIPFNRMLHDLGLVQLPPYLVNTLNLNDLSLQLRGYVPAPQGTNALSLDFLQLSPLDGWRALRARGYGLEYGFRLVDDMMTDQLYVENSAGTNRAGFYVGSEERIYLVPGLTQRLYVLHDSVTGSYVADRTMSVRVWYRPRRSAL